MKKILTLFCMAAAMMLALSCDPENADDNTVSLEINAQNLAGTWEVYVEHDFAQGYAQKYRITFSGENAYTMWHMHQEPKNETGEWGSLTNVGNKYSGAWEYADGILSLNPTKSYSSYFQNSMSPVKYTYYLYNTETMESDPWYETPEVFVQYDKAEWTVKSLTKEAFTVKINMDTFVLEKKK